MNELYVFGTGNAGATRCYNTCFAIKQGKEYFMIDGGGGNTILRILEDCSVPLNKIHHIFLTHAHTDHILGVIWLIRMIGQRMSDTGDYNGVLTVYGHKEALMLLRGMCEAMLPKRVIKLFDERIIFRRVKNGSEEEILGLPVTFFNIGSEKMKQYGFTMQLADGQRLCFPGDEPLREQNYHYAKGADWLLHEAFCCYEERDRFKPYEKSHSTAKDACELAQRLRVKNLVLWHTEDKDLANRRKKYSAEKGSFEGELYIPMDGGLIKL